MANINVNHTLHKSKPCIVFLSPFITHNPKFQEFHKVVNTLEINGLKCMGCTFHSLNVCCTFQDCSQV